MTAKCTHLGADGVSTCRTRIPYDVPWWCAECRVAAAYEHMLTIVCAALTEESFEGEDYCVRVDIDAFMEKLRQHLTPKR